MSQSHDTYVTDDWQCCTWWFALKLFGIDEFGGWQFPEFLNSEIRIKEKVYLYWLFALVESTNYNLWAYFFQDCKFKACLWSVFNGESRLTHAYTPKRGRRSVGSNGRELRDATKGLLIKNKNHWTHVSLSKVSFNWTGNVTIARWLLRPYSKRWRQQNTQATRAH